MGRWTGARRRAALAACITACLIAAACGPGVSPLDKAFAAGLLTPDGVDRYGLTLSGAQVVVAAPTSNTGGNTRVAFWRVADAASTDQETCGTWISYGSMSRQQGAALRVRQSGGRTTAITVTNNVTWGARWGFNVHVMDSASSEPYHKIGGFILDEVFRPGGRGHDRHPAPPVADVRPGGRLGRQLHRVAADPPAAGVGRPPLRRQRHAPGGLGPGRAGPAGTSPTSTPATGPASRT